MFDQKVLIFIGDFVCNKLIQMDQILKRNLNPVNYDLIGIVRFLNLCLKNLFEMSLCSVIIGFGNFGSFVFILPF